MLTSVAHRVAFHSLLCEKKGFLHCTWQVFYTFLRWLRPRGACAPRNGLTHCTSKCFAASPRMCFAEQFPCSISELYNSTPPYSLIHVLLNNAGSQSLTGGFSPDRSDSPYLCHFRSLRWGFYTEPIFGQRVNEGFTKLAARDQFCCSAKIEICNLCVHSDSELDVLTG